MEGFDLLYKICMLGESGVGKSCIVRRFTDDVYSEKFMPTIGADFATKTLEDDGKVIKCHVWDTAGQERFLSLTANTIRGTQGAMFVYDISDRDSFLAVEKTWLQQLEQHTSSSDHVVKLLVGNKSDLSNTRAVPFNEAQEYAQRAGMPFLETSAKDAVNVVDAFKLMVATIRSAAPQRLPNDQDHNTVSLPDVRKRSLKSLCQCG